MKRTDQAQGLARKGRQQRELSKKRCSMLDEGMWAEIKVGNEHLRLFAEHNAQGVQASVYNVSSKIWIAPSESGEDLEQGKERAEVRAPGIPQASGER